MGECLSGESWAETMLSLPKCLWAAPYRHYRLCFWQSCVTDIMKTSCMLLSSAFSLSNKGSSSLSPALPFQLNNIYLISCAYEGKAGFLCHPAAFGAGDFWVNAGDEWGHRACRRRAGVRGRAAGSTGTSTPLGLCWGCPTAVTSVLGDWCSSFSSVEPHLVAFLLHFLRPLCLFIFFFF